MKISKSVKKLMSVVMMMALVFTSLAIAPKQAKAAEDETTTAPSVEVLGATLRLNDESGNEKQAMRFAIQIKNANLAEDCGIVLTAPTGKKIKVSVGEGNKKIYEVNGNTVTYTAAVTGIPTEYLGSDFTFSGFVTPISGNTSTTKDETKNLRDVAYSANYMINDEGQLEAFTEEENVSALTEPWGGVKQIAYLDTANYAGKYLKISFKLRRGAGEDDITVPYGAQVNNPDGTYPSVTKTNMTITDEWTSFEGYYDAVSLSSAVNLYISASKTSHVYVKDLNIEDAAHNVWLKDQNSGYDETVGGVKISLDEDNDKAWNTVWAKYGANHELTNKRFSRVRIEAEFQKDGKVVNVTDSDYSKALWVTVASVSDPWDKNKEVQSNCFSGVTIIKKSDLVANTIAFQTKDGGQKALYDTYDTVIIKSIMLID